MLCFGAFNVYFSDRAGRIKHTETAVEFFNKAQLTGWLAVQPNPEGNIIKNALVFGDRVEFVF